MNIISLLSSLTCLNFTKLILPIRDLSKLFQFLQNSESPQSEATYSISYSPSRESTHEPPGRYHRTLSFRKLQTQAHPPGSPHLLPSISHIEKSQTHMRLPVPMKEKGLLALITHPPETTREDEPLFFLCLWIRFRRKKLFCIQDMYSYPERIQCT